ncbi:MAG TPA: septum formation initiator family protein [Ruminiclostridium sp.]|nr:septum formation initiator family protein [Ruminiclostridium sp.]
MNKRRKFNVWTIILIAVFCYFAFTVYHQQSLLETGNSRMSALKANIRSEEVKKQQLEKQKSQINTDEFAEKIARDKLGYVKDGEKIYIDTNK